MGWRRGVLSSPRAIWRRRMHSAAAPSRAPKLRLLQANVTRHPRLSPPRDKHTRGSSPGRGRMGLSLLAAAGTQSDTAKEPWKRRSIHLRDREDMLAWAGRSTAPTGRTLGLARMTW